MRLEKKKTLLREVKGEDRNKYETGNEFDCSKMN